MFFKMIANGYSIWLDITIKKGHNIFECPYKLLVIKFFHQGQITLQHLINAFFDQLHGNVILQILVQSACGVEFDRQRLFFGHIVENANNYLLNMILVLEAHIPIEGICLACPGPHERLVAFELGENVTHQHFLHRVFQVGQLVNLISDHSEGVHQGFFFAPVDGLVARLGRGGVFLEIFDCKFEELL